MHTTDITFDDFSIISDMMQTGMITLANTTCWLAENINWLMPVLGALMTGFLVYKGLTMAVSLAQAIATVTADGLKFGWIGALASAATLTVGVLGLSKALSTVGKADMPDLDKQIADYKKLAGEGLQNIPVSAQTKMPVEITNSAPIKVKGEVEIEQEDLRYLMDLAGQKYLAKFSTATLAPQVNIYGQTIQQTADINDMMSSLTGKLIEGTQLAAEGVY